MRLAELLYLWKHNWEKDVLRNHALKPVTEEAFVEYVHSLSSETVMTNLHALESFLDKNPEVHQQIKKRVKT